MRPATAARRDAGADPSGDAPVTVLVGKDILELVSTAMYTDPLTIYREYIQNAADAIDMAVQAGNLNSRADGRIQVRVDPATREARVRDNGVGVPAATAPKVLSAFGASVKRGQGVRGFRGIGRLGALGFCQVLTFTTKASGEAVITEVRWDCRRIRDLLRDPQYAGTLEDIVREVVTIQTVPAATPGDHFFEVKLQQVVRMRGDALLNEDAIGRYLAQVAPVPFSTDFPFAAEISAFLREYLPGGHFEITVEEGGAPLVRPHHGSIQVTNTKQDTYVGWDPIVVEAPELQTPAAVGWVAHHNYIGGISAAPEVRGLRARVGDIQVGDADLLADIFPEARFNAWVVGELHVLDPRVVPNGRRDDFEQHPAVASLHNRLGPLGRMLTQRTRESSKERARRKTFDRIAVRMEGGLATLEEGLVRGAAAQVLFDEVGEGLRTMEKLVVSELFPVDDPAAGAAILTRLRERHEAVRMTEPAGPHPLEHLSPGERGVFDRVMGIVFECAGGAEAARALLEQITKRVAAG